MPSGINASQSDKGVLRESWAHQRSFVTMLRDGLNVLILMTAQLRGIMQNSNDMDGTEEVNCWE